MRKQRTKLAVFCVLWAVVVAVAVIGIRYFADPQRQIDRHIAAMRPLYETMEREPGHHADSPVRQEWKRRQDELVRLGHLTREEYVVALRGNSLAQGRLYQALAEYENQNWLADWNYRPGSGAGIIIEVTDEPGRAPGWQDVINEFGVAEK